MQNAISQILWWALAIGLFLSSIILWIVAPEYPMFILGIFLLSNFIFLVLLFINRMKIIKVLKSSFFKNASTNVISIFLTMCILGMINYLGVKNNFHHDISRPQINTLSDQSKTIVSQIKESMKVTLFARRENWEKYLNLLNLYKYQNKYIQLEAIDVDSNPALVQINGVKDEGTIIVEYQGKKVSTVAVDELSVTNILIKLFRNKNIVIYYTIGHQELNPSQTDQEGGSYLFKKITDANYNLKPLDLLKNTEVPSDARLLMIVGPKESFLDLELKALEKYLEKGGNLFVSLAPELNEVKLTSFYSMINRFGLNFVNSIVLDRLSTVQGTQATIPIITDYNPDHSVTKKFSGKTLFPLSATIMENKDEKFLFTPLVRTSLFPGSWAETNFEEVKSGKATYDENDIKGPIILAATIENKKSQSRICSIASTALVMNAYQGQSANFNFFLNLLAWTIDDEGIISLNRPALESEMILMSTSQVTLIFYFAIAFFPFSLFAIAFYLYRRRLRK